MATETPVAAFNKVLASTLQGVVPEMGMNVYNGTPILNKILANGNKRPWVGEAIRVKIVGDTYKTALNYTDYDDLNPMAQEPFTVGDFEMAGVAQTVTLAGMQMRKNMGAKRLFDIVKEETKVAMQSMRDIMATNMFATTNTSKGILSLYTITDASTTIAGISASSKWGGTTTASGSFATQGKSVLLTLKQTLSQYTTIDGKATSTPDLIVTTNSVYGYIYNALEGSQRYSSTDADFGLNIKFDGTIVATDPTVSSGVLYMVNTKHLWLYVSGDADFSVSEDLKPTNQDAFTRQILWNGQLVTNARRMHGKLTGVSA